MPNPHDHSHLSDPLGEPPRTNLPMARENEAVLF
jgi:hypothetical protein